MDFTYEIIPEKSLVKETYAGRIEKQGLMEAFSLITEDPLWKKQMNYIANYSSAQVKLNYKEMDAYANWARKKDKAKYIAIVVSSELEFGMARMFEMLTEPDLYEECKFCYDLKEAEQWIESKSVD